MSTAVAVAEMKRKGELVKELSATAEEHEPAADPARSVKHCAPGCAARVRRARANPLAISCKIGAAHHLRL